MSDNHLPEKQKALCRVKNIANALLSKVIEGYGFIANYRKWPKTRKEAAENNLKLAKKHLKKNEISDAITRLWLIIYLFNETSEEIYYLLSLSYYLKGDLKNAQRYIDKVNSDNKDLANFIKNHDEIRFAPKNIEDILSKVTPGSFCSDYLKTLL